ncbi:MAG: Fic/DOC family N-terminal domain-containing protein, partial [Fidelibacterota bacterium]
MAKFDPNKPYNDLPLIPLTVDLETTQILKKAVTSGRALAELKGLGDIIPNQSILVNSLTLQEAKDSSEIENVVTTNDALFQAFTASTSKVDSQTKEVLRYREALWDGFVALEKKPILNTNVFIKIVQTIKKNTAGIRNIPGTKIEKPATGEIIYTPPEGEKVILT